MKSATDSFISSAYWTENIGYAAIATINFMKKNNVPNKLRKKGKKNKKYLGENWKIVTDNGKRYRLLPTFTFSHSKSDEMITILLKKCLKEGF